MSILTTTNDKNKEINNVSRRTMFRCLDITKIKGRTRVQLFDSKCNLTTVLHFTNVTPIHNFKYRTDTFLSRK